MVEGETLLHEAVASGWRVKAVYVAPGTELTLQVDAPVFELELGVIERVASTETPQPVLALVQMPWPDAAVLRTAGFVVVAHQLADPGNLGTILRSAEAAGADAVVVTPGSVDPFNPKSVRASAGSLFHTPLVIAPLETLAEYGLVRIGTSSHRGTPMREVNLRRRLAIVLGSEAHGLPDNADVDEWITIPHRGRSESLNVAMAAAVLCFEVARQRE